MTEDPGAGPPPESEGAEPDPGDLVGSVLAGRYRVVRRLGVGAMGSVYLGEHMRIGRRDAIKVLRASMARDPEAIARFTRGARNVSRILHPNVCTLYDFGDTEEGFHFLAMEYVDGPTLGHLLEEEGPLELPRAVALIRQVADALQAAHALGIVHRDLKPDNIMVAREPDGSERVKVVDFDIARGPAEEEEGPAVTRHGFVVGTPEYMSPEQLTGDPLDGRSDVYSMALVFFRILTGRLPFEGDTAQEIMVQRLTRDPRGLAEVTGRSFPPELEAAIADGLRRKPAERHPDAKAFAAAVVAAADSATGAIPGSAGAAAGGAGTETPGAATETPGATHGAGANREVPLTQVAGAASAPNSHGNRKLLVGIGAGASALLVAGVVAVLALGLFTGDDSTAPPGDGAPPSELAADGGSDVTDPARPAAGDSAAEGDDPPTATDPVEVADRTPPVAANPPVRDPTPPPVDPARTDPVPPPADPPATDPPAVQLDIDPADVQALLLRQMAAQDERPDRRTLEAVRDTADAVFRLDGVSRQHQAFAAYLVGLSLVPLGDSIRGVEWLEEAVRLEPIPRYISVRDLYRGGPR